MIEKIETLMYKGFKTDFFVTEKVKKYLKENNVNLNGLIDNPSRWYEMFFFEQIGDSDGKDFKVIYYGIKESLTEEGDAGFENKPDCKKEKLVGDFISVISGTQKHKSFAIKYIILKE